jgi:tRNA1Val (adenine37-N6)-methyltransferase
MKVGTDGVVLGSWANGLETPNTIVDIGAGTGLIALMLAQRFENAKVTAVEIEQNCARQCFDNIKNSPYSQRVLIENTSIQNLALSENEPFDLLVSNPPFFIDAYASENDQRNLARHNTTLRQHELWKSVTDLSHEKSAFCIILPINEGELFIAKGKEYPWHLASKVWVKGSPDSKAKRVLMRFTRIKTEYVESEIVLEKERGTYTDAFKEWVKEFYLNL